MRQKNQTYHNSSSSVMMHQRNIVIGFVLFAIFIMYVIFSNTYYFPNHDTYFTTINMAELKSCKCVFLDVGANRGVHTRKLYEPRRYAFSAYMIVFDEHIHSRCSLFETCSVLFEANPLHYLRLAQLQRYFQLSSYKVWSLPFAACAHEGFTLFSNPAGSERSKEEWGFRRAFANDPGSQYVYCLNFTKFLLTFLDDNQHVLMKLDVEGSEYSILKSMNAQGASHLVDAMTVEWHNIGSKDYLNRHKISKVVERVIELDDESVVNDPVPMVFM